MVPLIMINFGDEINKTPNNDWNVHDCYKSKNLEQLREICQQESLPFAVCALSVTGELNIGMIMRSASLLGVEKMFMVGRRKYDKRSTVGAYKYLDLERIDMLNVDSLTIDGDSVIDLINDRGYTPVAVEGPNPYNTPHNVRRVDWNTIKSPCLIVGSESDGLPAQILKRCQFTVGIHQRGVLRSFNVSAAASIVMYEVASQLLSD